MAASCIGLSLGNPMPLYICWRTLAVRFSSLLFVLLMIWGMPLTINLRRWFGLIPVSQALIRLLHSRCVATHGTPRHETWFESCRSNHPMKGLDWTGLAGEYARATRPCVSREIKQGGVPRRRDANPSPIGIGWCCWPRTWGQTRPRSGGARRTQPLRRHDARTPCAPAPAPRLALLSFLSQTSKLASGDAFRAKTEQPRRRGTASEYTSYPNFCGAGTFQLKLFRFAVWPSVSQALIRLPFWHISKGGV